MEFTDICFITENVLKLKTFYETVFGVKAEGDEYHSVLVIGNLALTLDCANILKDNKAFRYVSGKSSDNTIISFNVDDVDAEYQRLLPLGVEMLNQPTTHTWGARSFQFRDLEGNILNFRCLLKELNYADTTSDP